MPPLEFDSSLAALKALADATRLKLIGLIADRECSVGDLARRLKLTEPTVSHHLSKLRAGGLVTMRTEGTAHFYRLDAEALRLVGKSLAPPAATRSPKMGNAGDDFERKVLDTFVVDGALTKIPDKRNKRDVILKWLAGQFERGKNYSEAAVSARIKKIHPDFATLRRELIMAKLLTRENNIYRRP